MMKKTVFAMLLLMALALSLSACGQVKEKAAEKAAEKLVEQAAGGDVEVNIDSENNSVSIKDNDGNGMAVEGGENVDLKTFSAMGYDVSLPPGVVDGQVTTFTGDDGAVSGVTGRFQTDGSLDRKQLLQALDQSLTEAGLTFTDPFDDSVTKADFSDPQKGEQYHYKDDKGIQFFIVGTDDNEFVISGFKE